MQALFARLDAAGLDARAFAGARVAAIGPGTARVLAERGIRADIVPDRFVAEGLVDALAGVSVQRALIARASQARDVLPDALRARGAEVDILDLYETVIESLADQQAAAVAGADYLTFTSSSTVSNFLQAAGGIPDGDRRPRLASIGPVTSATLRERGLQPDVEAARYDIEGLIEAIVADVSRRRG